MILNIKLRNVCLFFCHFIWSLLALLGRLFSSRAHTIHSLGLDLCVLSVVKHAQHPDDDLSCFSIPHFLFAFIRTPLSFSPLFISIWLIPYTPIWSQPNYAYKHKMIKLNATCKVKSNVCCSSASERERERVEISFSCYQLCAPISR